MRSHYFGPQPEGFSPPPGTGRPRRVAWLCLGSIYHVNGVRPYKDGHRFLLLEMPPGAVADRLNTVLVRFSGRTLWPYCWVESDGRVICWGFARAGRLFGDGRLSPEARAGVSRNGQAPDWAGLDSFVPLFYVTGRRLAGPGWRLDFDLDLFSQVRFTPQDALFIRTSPRPFVALEAGGRGRGAALAAQLQGAGLQPAGPLAWLDRAIELHQPGQLFLNNHQCYYRKCFAGREIEVKFNLEQPQDIWSLTLDLYNLIRSGRLPGYIPEYRDEFQAWDYLNYVYEVVAPQAERGYISFIPCTNGRYLIKRKRYAADQLVRGELHYKDVDVSVPFDRYIRETYGVQPRALPSFRRVRYDVNFESLRSGHVYGIFFDLSTVLEEEAAAPPRSMIQCELEYLRSRTLVPPDEDAVLRELEEIVAWLRSFLDRKGLRYTQGFYSKLSFLKGRPVVAADEAPAPAGEATQTGEAAPAGEAMQTAEGTGRPREPAPAGEPRPQTGGGGVE